MRSHAKRLLLIGLIGGMVLGARLSSASAQFNANLPANPNQRAQAAYNLGARQGAQAGVRAGFQAVPLAPAYATGPYAPYQGAAGGYLSGAADVISSQGQFLNSVQDANLKKENVKQAKTDTRRKSYDEWLYERAKGPTWEDERERYRAEQLRRSRNDPPDSEILSGIALNQLLLAAQQMHAQQILGPIIPLASDVLPNINVTSGATTGNVGVLRDGGKLHWPLVLSTDAYQTDRELLDDLMPKGAKQAQYGAVDPDTVEKMIATVKDINSLLTQNIDSLTMTDYSKAKRFLRDVNGSIQALQDPNVSKYLAGKWIPQGNTVGQLVAQMSTQGLKFAPAVQGDEGAYRALHTAMVAYYQPDPSRPWDPSTK